MDDYHHCMLKYIWISRDILRVDHEHKNKKTNGRNIWPLHKLPSATMVFVMNVHM